MPLDGASGMAIKRILPHLLIIATVSAGALSGQLSSILFGLADLSVRISPRQASGDVVIVAIDSQSLDQLGAWPWSRGIHARVLDRLLAAGAH